MIPNKERCSVSVRGEGQWGVFHPHRCVLKGVVERDGKLYCKVHDPVEKQKRVDETSRRRREKFARQTLEREAANQCESVNHDNPMAVAESIKEMYEALMDIQKFTVENFAIGSVPQQVICGKCFLALAKSESKKP